MVRQSIDSGDKTKSIDLMYQLIEANKNDYFTYMHAVLLPEYSAPVKMPGDGLMSTYSFIQKTVLNFSPNQDGDFFAVYFPTVVSSRIPNLFIFSNDSLNQKKDMSSLLYNGNNAKYDSFNQFKDANVAVCDKSLMVRPDMVNSFRIPASSIRIKNLSNTGEITGCIDFVRSQNTKLPFAEFYGKNQVTADGSVWDALINVINTYSETFNSVGDNWNSKHVEDEEGFRAIYIPKDGSDYEFKNESFIPNNLQAIVIVGEGIPINKGTCIELVIHRHVEIVCENEYNDLLRPYIAVNTDYGVKAMNDIKKLPFIGQKKSLILNTPDNVDAINEMLKTTSHKSIWALLNDPNVSVKSASEITQLINT